MALWYVDNSLGTNGAGTSWAAAWNALANIIWSSVAAGDTIYISGGSTSQTYSEVLTVGKSGTAGVPITITAGIDAGHNGTVIIDRANAAFPCVNITSFTNITVQNLTLQNTNDNCLTIGSISSGTVTAQNLIIHTGTGKVTLTTNAATATGNATLHFASVPSWITGASAGNIACLDVTHPTAIANATYNSSATSTTFVMSQVAVAPGVSSGDSIDLGGNARGADIRNTTSTGTVILQNCTIDTPANTVAQTDCVWTSGNTSSGGVWIQNNVLTVNNTDPNGHSDSIQGFEDSNCTYRNNIISHPNGGVNNHGIIIANPITGGTYQVYNNLVVMGQSLGIGLPEVGIFVEQLNSGFNGVTNIYNNTCYGGFTALQWFPNVAGSNVLIKNNIFFGTPISRAPYLRSAEISPASNVDYNVVFQQDANLRPSYTSGTGIGAVRSTTSKTTAGGGLAYFEVQLGMVLTSGNTLIGLGKSTMSLSNFVGASGNLSVGYLWQGGQIYINGGSSTTYFLSKAGDILAFAVDFTNSKLWIKNLTTATGWNNAAIGSQNPVGNVGGFLFSAVTGPYFIAASVGAAGDYMVLNTGASPFWGTLPTGYSAWGSATTFNPLDMGSPCTMTPALAGSTLETWAQWQALGYDVHSQNLDPLFVNPSLAATSDATGFQVLPTSPANNNGTTLAVVATDYIGNVRPQGTAYDMGIFEALNPSPFLLTHHQINIWDH